MIRSMTGFGRGEKAANGWQCGVELRSVNSRFLELRFKLPTGLGHIEDQLKAIVKQRCERGKIECAIALTPENLESGLLSWNKSLLRQYAGMLEQAEKVLGRKIEVTLGNLTNIKDLIEGNSLAENEEHLTELIADTLAMATDDLLTMRQQEGTAIKALIKDHLIVIRDQLEAIKPLSASLPETYAQRLRENVERLTENGAVNQDRLLQEIALLADRYDVSEEINRFDAHLEHLDKMMKEGGALGRKVDFLLQEINREANTLAAKCNQAEISARVVEIKSELEKLREQIQNIE